MDVFIIFLTGSSGRGRTIREKSCHVLSNTFLPGHPFKTQQKFIVNLVCLNPDKLYLNRAAVFSNLIVSFKRGKKSVLPIYTTFVCTCGSWENSWLQFILQGYMETTALSSNKPPLS